MVSVFVLLLGYHLLAVSFRQFPIYNQPLLAISSLSSFFRYFSTRSYSMIQQKCNKVTGLCDPNGFLKLIPLIVLGPILWDICVSGSFSMIYRISESWNWFFAPKTQNAPWPKCYWVKIQFLPKKVQKGPKWPKMANLPAVDHLGPFWVPLDPLGPFQAKIDFSLKAFWPRSTLCFRCKKSISGL